MHARPLPLLLFALTVLLAACGGGGSEQETPPQVGSAQTTVSTSVPLVPNYPASPIIRVVTPSTASTIDSETVTVRILADNWAAVRVQSMLFSIPNGVEGVTVIEGHRFGDSFFSIGVPLEPGTNSLLITAVGPAGLEETTSVNVSRSVVPGTLVELDVLPDVVFETPALLNGSIDVVGLVGVGLIYIDLDGDGRLDRSQDFQPNVSFDYPDAGIYTPQVVITTPGGVLLDSAWRRPVIRVTDPPSLDLADIGFAFSGDVRDVETDPLTGRVLVLTAADGLFVFDTDGAVVASVQLPGVSDPSGLGIDANGDAYIVDRGQNQLLKYSRAGGYSADPSFGVGGVVGSFGSGPAQFQAPSDVAAGTLGLGQAIWVADTGNGRIQVFDADGNHVSEFGQTWGTSLSPVAVEGDELGSLAVLDGVSGSLLVGNKDGALFATEPATTPAGGAGLARITVDQKGSFWVVDPAGMRVRQADRDADVRSTVSLDPDVPLALTVDLEGRILVALQGGTRLVRLEAVGDPMGYRPLDVVEEFIAALMDQRFDDARGLLAPERRDALDLIIAEPGGAMVLDDLATRVVRLELRAASRSSAAVRGWTGPAAPSPRDFDFLLRRSSSTGRWTLIDF